MAGKTYFIDPQGGDDARDGLSAAQARRTYATLALTGGDTVRFARGSVQRAALQTQCGEAAAGPITYGAYGSGPAPVFLGSQAVDGAAHWVATARENVWRCTASFPSEVCNLIFNHGARCGHLRWAPEDLLAQGQWHYTGSGANSSPPPAPDSAPRPPEVLYLYSQRNPGEYYASIECALWGGRQLTGGQHDIVFEDLAFRNAGVHGYQGVRAQRITFRRCEFRCIGGAVWDRRQRIRFGNAVEFWDGAQDVLVEHCRFLQIYDSGVTHQGSDQSGLPERLVFRHNLFVDNGMAAYECRGPSAREVYFEHNTCINAGGELSMQGEPPPRQSEIYPQPMGHHVFIWRICLPSAADKVYIRHNLFYQAEFGAAIYSVMDPAEEGQVMLDHNAYWQTKGTLLARLGGRLYHPGDWRRYQTECAQDAHSLLADPGFVDAARGDYRLRPDSPCAGLGMAPASAR